MCVYVLASILLSFLFIGPGTNNKTGILNKIDSNYDEKRHELIFNKDNKPSWLTGYLNRTVIERKCNKSKPCFASDQVVPLCATDNQTYLNPGVLQCAQQCNKTLKIGNLGFGPCPGHIFPPTPPPTTSTKKPVTTIHPHASSNNRIKIKGSIQRLLQWLGLHVHTDGGVYLADEEEYNSWWNV